MVYSTWPPVLRNRQSALVLQPSLVSTRATRPESVRTVSICTRRNTPSARRFRSDSATRAESNGWPGWNSSSRRMVAGRVWIWSALATLAIHPRSSGSKMSRRSSSTARRVSDRGRVSALAESARAPAESAGAPAESAGTWAARRKGRSSITSGRRCDENEHGPVTGVERYHPRSRADDRHALQDPVRAHRSAPQHVFPELAGPHQPALNPGPLRSLHVGPEVVAHHGDRSVEWQIQAPCGGGEEGRARLAGDFRRRVGRIFQRGHEGPRVEGKPLTLPEIAVSGQSHQRRPGHQVVEGLLKQRVGPSVAQVAQHYRFGRAPGAIRRAPQEREPAQVFQRGGEYEGGHPGEAPGAEQRGTGQRRGDDLI